MSDDSVRAEMEAAKSLVALMEAADRCRTAFALAWMALPEPLLRYYGIGVRRERSKPGGDVDAE